MKEEDRNQDHEKVGDTVPVGEKTMKKGDYRIDEVTNNAVVLLRNSVNSHYALMNLGVVDCVNAHDILDDLISQYVSEHIPPDNEYPKNISALVIGGDYREHKKTDDGRIVYIDHRMVYLRVVAALKDRQLPVTHIPTDKRAVKIVTVKEDGSFEVQERREGLNAEDAEMSEAEYEKLFESQY